MTANFTLDWLTTVKLTDVFDLRQKTSADMTPLDTANYVNETMRSIFHNQQLKWAVSEKNSQTFVGIATIDALQDQPKQAQIHLNLLPAFQRTSVINELFTRLRDFTNLELELPTVIAQTSNPVQVAALKQLNFQRTAANQFSYHH